MPTSRAHLNRSRHLSPPVWLGIAKLDHRPMISGLVGVAVLLMVMPAEITATIANPAIATTLGIADADVRIDIREPAIDGGAIAMALSADERIERVAHYQTAHYEVIGPEGVETLLVEFGDHEAFPVRYIQGKAPTGAHAIALSTNEARALHVGVGDAITLLINQAPTEVRVSGVYQDITNGGKTAKAAFTQSEPVLWQMIYADARHHDAAELSQQIETIAGELAGAYPGAKVTRVADHASQTLHAMDRQLLATTIAVVIATGLLLAMLVVLITVLIRARERADLTSMRAIGCSLGQIRQVYLTRAAGNALAGIAVSLAVARLATGWFLEQTLGQMGAPGVQLTPNLWVSGVAIPSLVMVIALGATWVGLEPLRTIPVQPNAD